MSSVLKVDRIQSDTGTINLASGISFTSGLVSAPSIFPSGDTNTGIFFPAADQVGIATNGVERVEFGNSETVFNDGGANVDFRVEGDSDANLLFVDASADRIGVKTNTPAVALDVVGQVRASTGILFGSDTAAANALDDYEEGLSDLVVRIGSTEIARTVNGLRHVKIGNFVFITCSLAGIAGFAKGANSGDLRVDLPFAVPSGFNSTGAVRYESFSPTAGTITIYPVVLAGTSHAKFQMFSTTGFLDSITNNQLGATATIFDFTVCYFTT